MHSFTLRHRGVATPWLSIQEFVLPPNFAVPAHDHKPPHALVMLNGSLTERDGSTQHVYDARSVRYSPGGDTHNSIRIGPDGAHLLVVEARGFPELRLVSRIFIDASEGRTEVDNLHQCLLIDDCVSPAAVERASLALFTLARARSRSRFVQHHEWIAEVRQFLDTCGATGSPLADAAAHVERNASVVARVFRATYGIPVHRFYRECQIDRAWKLLATTNTALSTIALQCGFTDQSHLSRVLLRESGKSPAQLRKQMVTGCSGSLHWYRSTPFTTTSLPTHS